MNEHIEFNVFALGTLNHIKLYDCTEKSIVNKIIERLQEIDDHMSAFKSSSDISKIVFRAGTSSVQINTDTWEVLDRALWYYRNSNGAFDITIRPLIELWGIGKKKDYIPSKELITDAKEKINASKIYLNSDKLHAKLDIEGGAIDLGGIAKGYAADEVKRIILENGIKNAIINLGGNIVTIGLRPDRTPWKIGIQNPLAPRGDYLGVITVNDKTIVTSGSNEQFFIKDKVRYHHIIDPRTGYPAHTSLFSVTAVCDKSIDADALTTSLFVLGPEKGMDILTKVGAEAIFVTETMDLIITNGLKDKFMINKIQSYDTRRNMYVC